MFAAVRQDRRVELNFHALAASRPVRIRLPNAKSNVTSSAAPFKLRYTNEKNCAPDISSADLQ
jgi:hypothetical protein